MDLKVVVAGGVWEALTNPAVSNAECAAVSLMNRMLNAKPVVAIAIPRKNGSGQSP